jgi:hypothetical protein
MSDPAPAAIAPKNSAPLAPQRRQCGGAGEALAPSTRRLRRRPRLPPPANPEKIRRYGNY